MGCLFATFGAFFPRLAVLFIWIARPALFEAALGSALIGLIGIIFLLGLAVGLSRVPDRPRRTDLVRVRQSRTRRRLLQRREHGLAHGFKGGSLSLSPNAFCVLGSRA